jgi:tRNA A-37 threonylcarbamoyl transferase component Bud32
MEQYKEITLKLDGKRVQLLKKYCNAEVLSLIKNIENSMLNTEYCVPVKDDEKTTIGRIKGQTLKLPFDLLLKRFNYNGIVLYALKNLFRNRAKYNFTTSLHCLESGINVPEPIAFIMVNRQRTSYYISQYIDNAHNLLISYKKELPKESREFTCCIAETIAKLHTSGVRHGDLNWSNILLQKHGQDYSSFLIDLEQTIHYRSPSTQAITKDLIRFCRSGILAGASQWVESAFLPEYLGIIPDTIKSNLNIDDIKQKAHKK